MRQIADELMDEREEHGLDRDVGPRIVERRGPDNRPAGADLSFRRGDRAIVEAREDAIGRLGLQRAVAEHMGGGEVAAARRLEHFEDRVAVVEVSERAAAAAGAVDRRAKSTWQQRRLALRPAGVIAGRYENAAAALQIT